MRSGASFLVYTAGICVKIFTLGRLGAILGGFLLSIYPYTTLRPMLNEAQGRVGTPQGLDKS